MILATLLVSLLSVPGLAKGVQEHSIEVTKKGFSPTEIRVEANKPLILNVTRKTDQTCAKKLTIPEHEIEHKLPLNKTVAVKLTPKKGGRVTFGCAMNQMVGGILVVN